MKSDEYKVVRAVREIESKDIIHEYFDVMDYGVDVILSWYGITEEWNEQESKILKEYLLECAYRDEINEVRRIMEEENDWLLASIPDREASSLKLLMLEHDIWKKEMKMRNENPKDSQLICEVEK
jgi:hypothetical protein